MERARQPERVHAAASPTRCPYCHEAADADGTVACVTCLARHHAGCWDEHGRCSACGEGDRLERAAPRVATPAQGWRATLVLAVVMLATTAAAALAGLSADAVDRMAFLAAPLVASLLTGLLTRSRRSTIAAAVVPMLVLGTVWLLDRPFAFRRLAGGPLGMAALGLVLALPGLAAAWWRERRPEATGPKRPSLKE